MVLITEAKSAGGGGSTNDKGYFLNSTALTTAYPVGQAGWFAEVGNDSNPATIYLRDDESSAWVNTGVGATSDHSLLQNLSFSSSGHTGFQALLQSGVNIKTINNISILSGGNVDLQTPLSADVDYLTPLTATSTFYPLNTNPANYIDLTDISGIGPINYNSSNGQISVSQATSNTSGYLGITDWNNFNNSLRLDQTTPQTVSGGSPIFSGGISPDNIQLSITPTTGAITSGQFAWNSTDETIDVRLNSQVVMQVGQEQYIRVVNKTGAIIIDGQVVRISGAQGNRPTAVLAQSHTFTTSVVIGVATQNIAINGEGFVTTHGVVNGFDTSNFSGAGAYLYLSPTTPGILTDNITSPVPEFIVPVAVALNKTNNGSIFVSPFYPRSTDGTFAGNSNSYSPSEKAIKTYVDTQDKVFPVDINRYGLIDGQTTLSFDGTNTITLAPKSPRTTWDYYRAGLKYTITGSKTAVLTGTPVTTGYYHIYIDSTDGNLIIGGAWTLDDTKVPVATIYFNDALTPKFVFADERHTTKIDREYHRIEHFTEGTKYKSGAGLTGWTAGTPTDAGNTFGIGVGETTQIQDEDLDPILTALADPNGASSPYFNIFRTGASTWEWLLLDRPFKYTAITGSTYNFVQYDLNGTMTNGIANRYYNYYIFLSNARDGTEATDGTSTASPRFMFVPGRGQFSSTTLAYAESFASFGLAGFPIDEGVAVRQITLYTGGGGGEANTVKGRCSINRVARVNSNLISTTAVSTALHDSLGGLNGADVGITYGHINDQTQTIEGLKNFSTGATVPLDAYSSSWNNSQSVPTKNDIYDEMETKQDSLIFGIGNTNSVIIDSADIQYLEYARFTSTGLESLSKTEVLADLGALTGANISNTSYGSSWSGVSTIAPSKDAIYQKIESLPTGSGGGFWTAVTATRVNTTSCTVATDLTAIFKKGMVVKWKEGGVDHCGMVSIPSTYSSPDTTITIIGDTIDATPDAGTFKYMGADKFIVNFAMAGAYGATGTDIMNAWYADEPYRVLGADLTLGSVATTGAEDTFTIDINSEGNTLFTTKPTIEATVLHNATPFTADNASALALNDRVSIDIDVVPTTPGSDVYVKLYLIPTRYLFLT